MSDAGSGLDKAMKSVNDAISAKQKSDAAAAQKKAQSSYSGSKYGYSSNRNNGNNGYKYSGGSSSKKNYSGNNGSSGPSDTPQSKGWGCGDSCDAYPSDGHGCNPVTGACGIG